MRTIDSMKKIKLQNHECKLCSIDLEDKAIETTMGKVKELVCEKCGKSLSQFFGIPIDGVK